jgi:aminomethyltransferase
MLHTPLHSWHQTHQGRLVDFAGWSMPVQYESIVVEHEATRHRAALFDVSHMGRIYFQDPQAAQFLDRIVTRRVADLKPGQIRYGLICQQDGGVLDDVLVYRLLDQHDEPFFMMVVNASNRAKIVAWMQSQQSHPQEITWEDRTEETAMIALQGPHALRVLQRAYDIDMSSAGYYSGKVLPILGEPAVVSRTGYTGEDGCEIIVPSKIALAVWTRLLETNGDDAPTAAGLGARDTLRLEAGMPLYGHELSEQVDPLQAGLGFAVNLKDRDFIGKGAIIERQRRGGLPRRVGLKLTGRRVPRQHYNILSEHRKIGEVSSGTFSPTLGAPIAMGFLEPEFVACGTEVVIDIRGVEETATVVELPFYRRA